MWRCFFLVKWNEEASRNNNLGYRFKFDKDRMAEKKAQYSVQALVDMGGHQQDVFHVSTKEER